MSAPRLNRRLVLEAPDRVPDGAGGYRQTWVALGGDVGRGEARDGAGEARGLRGDLLGALPDLRARRAGGRPVAARGRSKGSAMAGGSNRIHAVTEADPAARFLVCYTYEEGAA